MVAEYALNHIASQLRLDAASALRHRRGMDITSYLSARGISYYTLADEADVAPETVRRIKLNLTTPNGAIIRKVVAASRAHPAPCGGTITANDLLSPSEVNAT